MTEFVYWKTCTNGIQTIDKFGITNNLRQRARQFVPHFCQHFSGNPVVTDDRYFEVIDRRSAIDIEKLIRVNLRGYLVAGNDWYILDYEGRELARVLFDHWTKFKTPGYVPIDMITHVSGVIEFVYPAMANDSFDFPGMRMD